jgi:acetylornithine/succinyldiaminopimelate/putrescine aminotransferase
VRAAVTDKTAAIMIEPVQGEGGVRPAPVEFLQGLRRIADDTGALLVMDEIQCGLGRTGKVFAFQHAGIVPDVLTLAKPLGGGLPMGATLLKETLAPAIAVGDHGSTFGGNPVAAAASLVVLERLTTPGFLDKVEKRARSLHRGLKKLARAYPKAVAEVRGLGLMVGIELHGEAGPVVKGLRERGFLATKAGDKVLRLLPPLVVKPGEVTGFLAALEEVLKGGAGAPS